MDELHVFLGTERGAQLHSLLSRIARYAIRPPRRIGLSATVGDRCVAESFLGFPCSVCDGTGPRKGLRLRLQYREADKIDADLFRVSRGKKALIFCNSRARVESTTLTLNRMAGSSTAYLPHHGSLHQRERSRAEATLHAAQQGSIVCTSTLELGIDVGGVDLVVQVDCTQSVSGLRQRLGRSGRTQGQDRVGQLYASDEEGLVQTVAVVELMREGWVEPPLDITPAYDVSWHQALSIAVERGLTAAEAAQLLPATLLDHMLEQGHLEWAGNQLIAGWEGQRLAHHRDFYSVFRAEEAYEVAHGSRVLGTLPPLPIYHTGTALILAGHIWTLDGINHNRKRMQVIPGAVENPPVFTSQPMAVHDRVRQKMVAVLLSGRHYPYLDQQGHDILERLSQTFGGIGLGPCERPVYVGPECSTFYAFAGDRVANTLALMLQRASGVTWEVTGYGAVTTAVEWPPLVDTLRRYGRESPDPAALQEQLLDLIPDRALRLPKFGPYLPPVFQRKLHAQRALDVPGALRLLTECAIEPAGAPV